MHLKSLDSILCACAHAGRFEPGGDEIVVEVDIANLDTFHVGHRDIFVLVISLNDDPKSKIQRTECHKLKLQPSKFPLNFRVEIQQPFKTVNINLGSPSMVGLNAALGPLKVPRQVLDIGMDALLDDSDSEKGDGSKECSVEDDVLAAIEKAERDFNTTSKRANKRQKKVSDKAKPKVQTQLKPTLHVNPYADKTLPGPVRLKAKAKPATKPPTASSTTGMSTFSFQPRGSSQSSTVSESSSSAEGMESHNSEAANTGSNPLRSDQFEISDDSDEGRVDQSLDDIMRQGKTDLPRNRGYSGQGNKREAELVVSDDDEQFFDSYYPESTYLATQDMPTNDHTRPTSTASRSSLYQPHNPHNLQYSEQDATQHNPGKTFAFGSTADSRSGSAAGGVSLYSGSASVHSAYSQQADTHELPGYYSSIESSLSWSSTNQQRHARTRTMGTEPSEATFNGTATPRLQVTANPQAAFPNRWPQQPQPQHTMQHQHQHHTARGPTTASSKAALGFSQRMFRASPPLQQTSITHRSSLPQNDSAMNTRSKEHGHDDNMAFDDIFGDLWDMP